MTARTVTSTRRWQIPALVIAALLAVVLDTIANGFLGEQWFFNADNVVDALPLAVPFLIAAGVIAGQDRWPSGRSWLVAGAWLLALSGALALVLEVQVALIQNDSESFIDAQPWVVVSGAGSTVAQALGFGSLATGLWLSRPTEWGGVRRAVAVGLALVLAVAAAGPFAVINLIPPMDGPSDPSLMVVLLGQVIYTLVLLALAALAVAGVRAAPPVRPLPELLIAGGASVSAIATGITWWAFYTTPDFTVLAELSAVSRFGLLVVAAGFGSGAMFWPVDEERSATAGQPSA
jgi:hypothetical protein